MDKPSYPAMKLQQHEKIFLAGLSQKAVVFLKNKEVHNKTLLFDSLHHETPTRPP